MNENYPRYSRWIDNGTKKVWEKREWGWKFLGYAESCSSLDIMKLLSHDWDSIEDVFDCRQEF